MEYTYITGADVANMFTRANLVDFAYSVGKFGLYAVGSFIAVWFVLVILALILVYLFDWRPY